MGGKMADFSIALKPVLEWEGEYSNDPADRGGETYRGISRKNFPSWKGWQVIIAAKKQAAGEPVSVLNEILRKNEELQQDVEKFYRTNFWTILRLDDFPQIIANEVFEQAINMGPYQAIKNLQKFCNAANYNPKTRTAFTVDLTEDGKNGPKTKSLVKQLLKDRYTEEQFLNALKYIQGSFYIDLAHKNKSQRKFLKGWLSRA